MAEFKPLGPFKIKYDKRAGGGRTVQKNGFWEESEPLKTLKKKCGIYVFAIKPPRTRVFTPCYVGQAKKTFGAEAFTNDKLHKYNDALADYKKGAPYMFFLAHPDGKKNIKQIGELEDYLIMMGFAVNLLIQNDKGARLPNWAVTGVIRDGGKKPSNAANHVAKMFKIKSRKGV